MPEPTGLAALAAQIERDRMRQALKGQLIRGWEWEDGVVGRKKIPTAHLLVGGKPVRLTPEQLAELEGDQHG